MTTIPAASPEMAHVKYLQHPAAPLRESITAAVACLKLQLGLSLNGYSTGPDIMVQIVIGVSIRRSRLALLRLDNEGRLLR